MKKIAIVALYLLSPVPVLAQSVSEKTGVNSLFGAAPSTQDFVTEAAISDMFEMQSSKLAEEKKATKADAFSQRMIADHTSTTDAIRALVQSGKVKANIPTALDSSHQSKVDKLKGLSGAEFEKQFRTDQIAGHKDAVDLYKRYADGGDNADLKAFVQKTLPTLEKHQKLAEQLPMYVCPRRGACPDRWRGGVSLGGDPTGGLEPHPAGNRKDMSKTATRCRTCARSERDSAT